MIARDATAVVDVAHRVDAGRPIRAATLDVHRSRTEQATARALLAAGAEIAIALRASDPRHFGERAQALRDARPDVVVIAVADRAAADHLALLAEALRFGCAAQRPRPRVLLASSDDGAIARISPHLAPFSCELVPDVRRDDGRRRVVARIRELRREQGVLRDEAVEELARRSAEAAGPTLVVDVTGASTSLVRAEVGAPTIAVHARPLGVGRGADHVVARAGLERVRRWIPWGVDPPTLLERVFNRARWPDAVAAEGETLALEVALAHEAIAHALVDASAVGVGHALRAAARLLLTGRLAELPGRSRGVLVAVNAVGPVEPASIAADRGDRLVALAAAALAGGDTDALARALREVASPVAALVPVATARRATVRLAAATTTREERVDRDAFYVLWLEGPVEVSGTGVHAARVTPGPIGLVVDARPRPLTLPARDAERVPAVTRWYEALGAMPMVLGRGASGASAGPDGA